MGIRGREATGLYRQTRREAFVGYIRRLTLRLHYNPRLIPGQDFWQRFTAPACRWQFGGFH